MLTYLNSLTVDKAAFLLSAAYAGAGLATHGPFGGVFLWSAVMLGAFSSLAAGMCHE